MAILTLEELYHSQVLSGWRRSHLLWTGDNQWILFHFASDRDGEWYDAAAYGVHCFPGGNPEIGPVLEGWNTEHPDGKDLVYGYTDSTPVHPGVIAFVSKAQAPVGYEGEWHNTPYLTSMVQGGTTLSIGDRIPVRSFATALEEYTTEYVSAWVMPMGGKVMLSYQTRIGSTYHPTQWFEITVDTDGTFGTPVLRDTQNLSFLDQHYVPINDRFCLTSGFTGPTWTGWVQWLLDLESLTYKPVGSMLGGSTSYATSQRWTNQWLTHPGRVVMAANGSSSALSLYEVSGTTAADATATLVAGPTSAASVGQIQHTHIDDAGRVTALGYTGSGLSRQHHWLRDVFGEQQELMTLPTLDPENTRYTLYDYIMTLPGTDEVILNGFLDSNVTSPIEEYVVKWPYGMSIRGGPLGARRAFMG